MSRSRAHCRTAALPVCPHYPAARPAQQRLNLSVPEALILEADELDQLLVDHDFLMDANGPR